jgi:hypothetical protein
VSEGEEQRREGGKMRERARSTFERAYNRASPSEALISLARRVQRSCSFEARKRAPFSFFLFSRSVSTRQRAGLDVVWRARGRKIRRNLCTRRGAGGGGRISERVEVGRKGRKRTQTAQAALTTTEALVCCLKLKASCWPRSLISWRAERCNEQSRREKR